ncbi:hypothetical protein AB0C29_06150 [Actinoplanes sp. NPDC048791]|uniref:hypothetical protein n=1 Tax=Actinoplanes sp. NPDC048791 TaxID=3154623 RepID=UPI0033F6EDFF
MPALIEVVTDIQATAGVVFELELDMDVHSASLAASRALVHEHVFEELGGGRTRMIDRMTVTAPFGPLGALVTRVVLSPYLRRLLEQRAAHIKQLAENQEERDSA